MAARQEVTFVISARDRTRSVFRAVGRSVRRLRLSAASFIGGGLFAAATRGALDFATAIEGASQRLDVSTETLQGLKILAEDLNIPFETLQGVIQRISRNAGQALTGDTRLIDAFADLGITLKELRALNTEDLFFAVADAAADTTKSWRETSAALARVGDTEAVRLRGLLVQGGDALAAGVNALKDADKLQGPEALKAAAEAEAKLRRELIAANKAFTEAVVTLTPILNAFVSVFGPAAQAYADAIARGQATGGYGVGRKAAEILGPERIATAGELSTLPPDIRKALLDTAAATKQTAQTIDRVGTFR